MLDPILPPDRWGNDTLSDFQKAALFNEFATYTGASPWHMALSAVAADLETCAKHAIAAIPDVEDPTGLLLFISAHNLFLASARLVASGHCLPAHPTSRATVEMALYGWYVATNPGAGERWHNKPTEKKARREWGDEFKFSNLADKLSEISDSAAEWAKYMHQTAIDFGAHPNKNSIYAGMSRKEITPERIAIEVAILERWNNNSIATTKFVLETGIFSLEVFSYAFGGASLSDFLCERGHEIIPKGKFHDRRNDHKETEEAESTKPHSR